MMLNEHFWNTFEILFQEKCLCEIWKWSEKKKKKTWVVLSGNNCVNVWTDVKTDRMIPVNLYFNYLSMAQPKTVVIPLLTHMTGVTAVLCLAINM